MRRRLPRAGNFVHPGQPIEFELTPSERRKYRIVARIPLLACQAKAQFAPKEALDIGRVEGRSEACATGRMHVADTDAALVVEAACTEHPVLVATRVVAAPGDDRLRRRSPAQRVAFAVVGRIGP